MLERRMAAASILLIALATLVAAVAIGRDGALTVPVVAAVAVLGGLGLAVIARAVAPRQRHRALRAAPAEQASEARQPDIADMVGMLNATLAIAHRPGLAMQPLQPVDLVVLLSDAHARHGVEILGMPASLATPADANALSRLFDDLIANALSGGTCVNIRVDHGTTALVVHVDDDGPGVPRAERARVFEEEYYLSVPPAEWAGRCAELVTARQIARAHGGDITISCSPEGGARFTVRLPLLDRYEPALEMAS